MRDGEEERDRGGSEAIRGVSTTLPLDRFVCQPPPRVHKHSPGSTCGVTDAQRKGPRVLQQPVVDLGVLNAGQNS